MLFQPCAKCGTMLTEDAPKFPMTFTGNGCCTSGTVCQACHERIGSDNENSKLLNG